MLTACCAKNVADDEGTEIFTGDEPSDQGHAQFTEGFVGTSPWAIISCHNKVFNGAIKIAKERGDTFCPVYMDNGRAKGTPDNGWEEFMKKCNSQNKGKRPNEAWYKKWVQNVKDAIANPKIQFFLILKEPPGGQIGKCCFLEYMTLDSLGLYQAKQMDFVLECDFERYNAPQRGVPVRGDSLEPDWVDGSYKDNPAALKEYFKREFTKFANDDMDRKGQERARRQLRMIDNPNIPRSQCM